MITNVLAIRAVEDVLEGSLGQKMLQGLKFSAVGMLTVLAVLAVIALFTLLLSRILKDKKTAPKAPAPAPGAPSAPAPQPETPEGVTVYDVDDETAAVLMAIVSDRSGIPLERLKFKSIRPVETKE